MDPSVYDVRARRLLRRGRFAAFAGFACGVFGIVVGMIDFFYAGLAFELAAGFYAFSSFGAARIAERQRQIHVRSLQP